MMRLSKPVQRTGIESQRDQRAEAKGQKKEVGHFILLLFQKNL